MQLIASNKLVRARVPQQPCSTVNGFQVWTYCFLRAQFDATTNVHAQAVSMHYWHCISHGPALRPAHLVRQVFASSVSVANFAQNGWVQHTRLTGASIRTLASGICSSTGIRSSIGTDTSTGTCTGTSIRRCTDTSSGTGAGTRLSPGTGT